MSCYANASAVSTADSDLGRIPSASGPYPLCVLLPGLSRSVSPAVVSKPLYGHGCLMLNEPEMPTFGQTSQQQHKRLQLQPLTHTHSHTHGLTHTLMLTQPVSQLAYWHRLRFSRCDIQTQPPSHEHESALLWREERTCQGSHLTEESCSAVYRPMQTKRERER